VVTFRLPNIPNEIEWKNQPLDWRVTPNGSLTILAGSHTDWFSDPAGEYRQDSAPSALFIPPHPSFILSTKVTVKFNSTFDAGVLQIRISDDRWAKLCFEYSPQNQPMIVSVVTRDKSDDCNSVALESSEVYLRAALNPQTIAFHYSADGMFWHFVRYFTLGKIENPRIGFSSQSPTGDQCQAMFSEIKYHAGTLKDLRYGE
jgi:regulation of enolase protein 1 (concanavalin A-like superfamily)